MSARDPLPQSPALRHRTTNRPLTAGAIAAVSAIAIERLDGDPTRAIDDAKPLGAAAAREIAFCTRDGADGAALIAASRAGVVVCTAGAAESLDVDARAARTLLITPTPRLTFARMLRHCFVTPAVAARHPTAWVHPSAVVADDVVLGAYVVIDANCEVGAGCVLHAHVSLAPGSRLGARVELHAGVVIGADGFGHERNAQGALEKFPQIGGVWIGDDVEIGANSCVSRGTLTDTIIESGVRVDNLVHIAHNVIIERDAVLTANAMIAGSTRIGARAWIAPSAAIMDGISIGADAVVGLGAVVIRSVADHAVVAGNPARALVKRTTETT
jgi:UDP-3-O-[3-hydroxymyristoyl] glucosamine N-acyltransferase